MKTKKALLSICLVFILLLSSVVLFACGNKSNSADAQQSYSQVLEDIKKDTSLFKAGTINDMQTNYYLNDLAYKDENGNLVYAYDNYVAILAVGLDFIEEYHVALERVKAKGNYSSLQDDVKSLTKKFNTLKTDHNNLLNDTVGLDYTIYNGYFARYKTSALNFVNETYSCALNLANFLNKKVKLAQSVGSEDMTPEAFAFYCDYNILEAFDDFREFFMDSCKGVEIENMAYQNVYDAVALWNKGIVKHDYKTLELNNVSALVKVFDNVDGEREMAGKALSKFSVYKFVTTYGASIDAYKKSNANASAYYKRIGDYYFNNINTLGYLYNYLVKNVVA